jgi:RsiW-degrading membrane proteinase PrsW (M82 family)
MAALARIFFVLAVGILPMVFYALVLWWFDRYEKEPAGLLVSAFLWGAIPAIIFSVVAELILGIPVSFFVEPVAANAIGATVIAPVVEEAFKGLALVLLLIFFHKEIDSPLDGIIYGGLVGFGFAAVENVFYFAGALEETGLGGVFGLAVFRAFLFGLNHALFTGLFGLGLALARTAPRRLTRIGAPISGLLAGVTAHAIHNGSVTLGSELGWPCLVAFASDWGGVLILMGIVIWTSVRERQWVVTHLAAEVHLGTLGQEDYAVMGSYLKRVAARTSALFAGDVGRWWRLGRYHRVATELAFNKHRLTRFAGEEDTLERVVWLRRQVKALGGALTSDE